MEDAQNVVEDYLDLDSLSPDINKSQKRLRENMRIKDSVYAQNMTTPRVLQKIERCTICKSNVESCRLGPCPREKMEEDILMNESCISTCSSLSTKFEVVENKSKAKKPN